MKSPLAQGEEQDIGISDLQEAIKLNKNEEARTSKNLLLIHGIQKIVRIEL